MGRYRRKSAATGRPSSQRTGQFLQSFEVSGMRENDENAMQCHNEKITISIETKSLTKTIYETMRWNTEKTTETRNTCSGTELLRNIRKRDMFMNATTLRLPSWLQPVEVIVQP